MTFAEAYAQFAPQWQTPFRFYHTKDNHLDPLLQHCDTPALRYFALFHDLVYDPYSTTNEEDSAQRFLQESSHFEDLQDPQLVVDMILATKDHKASSHPQIQRAIDLDMAILQAPFSTLLQYERQIFLEYQRTDINTYLEKRVAFLSQHLTPDIQRLIDYIQQKTYSIGYYAGSFDPFHVGHLDILKKAENLFDKVIIVRAVNPEKQNHTYSLPKSLPNQRIEHKGIITSLFKKDHKYTLIRGVRNEYDIASEMNYMSWVHEIDPTIPFVHLFCDPENIKVSSSALKSFTKIEGFDISKWMVP